MLYNIGQTWIQTLAADASKYYSGPRGAMAAAAQLWLQSLKF